MADGGRFDVQEQRAARVQFGLQRGAQRREPTCPVQFGGASDALGVGEGQIGRHAGKVRPARQRLEADHPFTGQVDDRLKCRTQPIG